MGMDALVSVAWLAERIADPAVVVMDATLPPVGVLPRGDTRARYREGHLPGAVFFDIEEFSDASSGLPHTLPGAAAFAEGMSQLGVAEDATVVVYEQGDVFSAPRAWWMLRVMGGRQVAVLDGGLRAWVDAGLPLERGEVQRARAEFRAVLDEAAVVRFDALEQVLRQHGQVLDARSAARFAGTAPEPRAGLRSGHMPGATSVPYTDLTEGGRMRPATELRAIFAARGVDVERPAVTTCGSGVTAAVVALGLEQVGARSVALYDGSWAEYAGRPGVTIVGQG